MSDERSAGFTRHLVATLSARVRQLETSDRRGAGLTLKRNGGCSAGFTLVELVIVVAIVGILAAAVLPLAHWSVKRQQEYELQQSLRILRNAIDRYHDLALAGMIELDPGDSGYPPDLETLVEGVELTGELPSPVPAVSGEFGATGAGLTGGIGASMDAQNAAGSGFGLPGGGGSGGQTGGGFGQPAGGLGQLAGAGGRGGRNAGGRVQSGMQGGGSGLRGLQGMLGSGQQQQQGQGGRGGLRGSTVANRGGFGTTSLADRRDRRAAPGQAEKIVLLRRIPIDPFTGEADWGMRCYGESLDDRSWCGREVFDVYSKGLGNGIDGRPYREW
jgi:prepilin-type N-terminal cleavage/methylation domain-containing protein